MGRKAGIVCSPYWRWTIFMKRKKSTQFYSIQRELMIRGVQRLQRDVFLSNFQLRLSSSSFCSLCGWGSMVLPTLTFLPRYRTLIGSHNLLIKRNHRRAAPITCSVISDERLVHNPKSYNLTF